MRIDYFVLGIAAAAGAIESIAIIKRSSSRYLGVSVGDRPGSEARFVMKNSVIRVDLYFKVLDPSRSFLTGLIMETIMKFIKVCIALTEDQPVCC